MNIEYHIERLVALSFFHSHAHTRTHTQIHKQLIYINTRTIMLVRKYIYA